jgi:hypothetical protein
MRVAIYAGKLHERIEELERENAALLDLLRRWEKLAAIGLVDVVPEWAEPVITKLANDTAAAIDTARKEKP